MIVLAKERLWRICKVGACSRVSSGFKLWHKLAWCGKKECGKSYLGSRSKRNPCTSQPVLRAVRQSHKDTDVPHKIWKMIIAINMLLSMCYPWTCFLGLEKREKMTTIPLSGVLKSNSKSFTYVVRKQYADVSFLKSRSEKMYAEQSSTFFAWQSSPSINIIIIN